MGMESKLRNQKEGNYIMNKPNIVKSTISRTTSPFVLAACLVLVALGPPAAELSRASSGRGGPPHDIDFTVTLPGICGFDVLSELSGREGVISLPGGSFLFIYPATFQTFTNLSDPTKSVTLNVTGPAIVSIDQDGNFIGDGHGRGVLARPSFGIWLFIGDWHFVFDPDGNIIEWPTGNGQSISVCDMIN
jgi:hypothetical protein